MNGTAKSAPTTPSNDAEDEHARDHQEARYGRRLALDRRLQDVVLGLLIDEYDGEHDERLRHAHRSVTSVRIVPAMVAPICGIRSSKPGDQAERERIGAPSAQAVRPMTVPAIFAIATAPMA